jgi:NYN domain
MKRESTGPILSTVFVDYDNIYLSLKRKNDDAAKRFAKDSSVWVQGLVSGELITPTSNFAAPLERRIAMNRCYGNPVPRRNAHDNSTDMNSFPFIRHHFLRSGFEVIDCPPLTAQLKNSADIRIVMDIRDIISHDTFFDEFIILSGDADFTPVLHRLRAHARRTVVFANDHTAQPYTAISDGEVRETSLIGLLLNSRVVNVDTQQRELAAPQQAQLTAADIEAARGAIVGEVVNFVRAAPQAVPLETLADRAVRLIGREKTVGTNWGGFGSFRDLLLSDLPDDLHLSDTAPYTVFDGSRHITATGLLTPQLAAPVAEVDPEIEAQAPLQAPAQNMAIPQQSYRVEPQQQPQRAFQAAPPPRPSQQPLAAPAPVRRAIEQPQAPQQTLPPRRDVQQQQFVPQAPVAQAPPPIEQRRDARPELRQEMRPEMRQDSPRASAPLPPPSAPVPNAPRTAEQATQIQQSITRIHEACQAPALAPAEYRVLFDVMAQEITANGLQGSQTLINVTQRAREYGLELKREDLRFILEVVSESDPWFEQGASGNLFASRFRNFVVARCRSQGISLSADELDLVEAWFSAQPAQARPAYARAPQQTQAPAAQQPAPQQAAAAPQAPAAPVSERWWSLEEGRQHIAEQRAQGSYGAQEAEEEFPRIVRSRLRG